MKSQRRTTKTLRAATVELSGPRLNLVVIGESPAGQPSLVRTRVAHWREPGQSLHSEAGIASLCSAFKRLVAAEQLEGQKLQLAINGDYCVTRAATGPKDRVRQELAKLQDRGNLYLALGPGFKVVAVSVSALDARHDHGLVSVANRRTLDAIAAAARKAGATIERVEASLVSLSRLVGRLGCDRESPVLLLNLSDGGPELGITHGGRLVVDYRPGGRSETGDVASSVARHLSRLRRYCDRYYRHASGKIERVILFGPPDAAGLVQNELKRQTDLTAELLDLRQQTAWAFAASPPDPTFCAALGAGLAAGTPDGVDPGPNLMAEGSGALEPARWTALPRALWPVAAGILLSLGMVAARFYEKTQCDKLSRRLAAAETEQVVADSLRADVMATESMIDHLAALRNNLAAPDWADMLSNLAHCLPHDVWLRGVSLTPSGKMAISGSAFEENSVYEFMRWVDQAPDWERVVLVATRVSQFQAADTIDFDVECEFSPSAKKSEKASIQ
jgi:hypothetical protein